MSILDPDAVGIAQSIQLAFAPALLLSVVGVLLGVLSNRLAAAIERARRLSDAVQAAASGIDLRGRPEQLRFLVRRASLLYRAITLMVTCGLLVAVVVLTIFLNALVATDFARLIAILFMLAMLSLIASLMSFLREVFLAIKAFKTITRASSEASPGGESRSTGGCAPSAENRAGATSR